MIGNIVVKSAYHPVFFFASFTHTGCRKKYSHKKINSFYHLVKPFMCWELPCFISAMHTHTHTSKAIKSRFNTLKLNGFPHTLFFAARSLARQWHMFQIFDLKADSNRWYDDIYVIIFSESVGGLCENVTKSGQKKNVEQTREKITIQFIKNLSIEIHR